MRLLIALIFPWLTFFTIGRPIAGFICLFLQLILIGWIPATIWAVYALSQFNTDRKIAKAMEGKTPNATTLAAMGEAKRRATSALTAETHRSEVRTQ